MADFFRALDLDQISFWVGFVGASLFWWLAIKSRPIGKELFIRVVENLRSLRDRLTTSINDRYRAELVRYAQGLHLASHMCSLDEILIQPKVLVPPAVPVPGKETENQDIATQLVPYLPDWPEIPTAFHSKTISLAETLRPGANILLIAPPGYGKTVALAHLACQIARREQSVAHLHKYLPVLLHVSDLQLPLQEDQPLIYPLVEATSKYFSPLVQQRLPGLFRTLLKDGGLLLLVDGLDEVETETVRAVYEYLGNLLRENHSTRIVAAASTEYYGGLPGLKLFPVGIASWDINNQHSFIDMWRNVWVESILTQESPREQSRDLRLVRGWLVNSHDLFTPFEYTLKVWAAFAGDALGPSVRSAMEAYLRRMTEGIPDSRLAIRQLAFEIIARIESEQNLNDSVATVVEPDAEMEDQQQSDGVEESATKIRESKTAPKRRIIDELLKSGLLISCSRYRLRFNHILFTAYLAGEVLSMTHTEASLLDQQDWSGKTFALLHFAAQSEASSLLRYYLESEDEPLYLNLLRAARWLKYSEANFTWRSTLMRSLAKELQNETLPISLRARLLTALVLSGDNGIAVMLRHLCTHAHPEVRFLAVLGCGLVKDQKAIADLNVLTSDSHPEVRKAACLAIGIISGPKAVELIASILLHGDEDMRQAAAETLAGDPSTGYETLREGSIFEDLLVRRAVTFGLKKVGERWAYDLLSKIQMEDGQWVVRDAAQHALEQANRPPAGTPETQPVLQNTPWLIAFASERGLGISSEERAREMLVTALKDGDDQEKLSALARISTLPDADEGLVAATYNLLYGTQTMHREAAYHTLWSLAASGINIPHPMQYGFA